MKAINNLTKLPLIKPVFCVILSCICGMILVSNLALPIKMELPAIKILVFTISFSLICRYILTILKKNYDEHRHFQCNCSVGEIWRDF